MLKTAQYVETLPPYGKEDALAQSWAEASKEMYQRTVEDVTQLLRDARALCPLPLLPDVQVDPILWAKPSNNMGGLRLLCPEEYLARTKRPTVAQQKANGIYNYCYGMEVSFELFRRWQTPQESPKDACPSSADVTLQINGDPELDAFREIYRDWRGIAKKLLEGTLIEVNSCCDVYPELERVRSRHPIPLLDAILSIPSPKDYLFQLEFHWRHDTGWDAGLRSFLAQAVLFTSIQRATESPRSHREHLLDYWLGLADTWKKLGGQR